MSTPVPCSVSLPARTRLGPVLPLVMDRSVWVPPWEYRPLYSSVSSFLLSSSYPDPSSSEGVWTGEDQGQGTTGPVRFATNYWSRDPVFRDLNIVTD